VEGVFGLEMQRGTGTARASAQWWLCVRHLQADDAGRVACDLGQVELGAVRPREVTLLQRGKGKGG
jgi:hypothetical protein